jgi:hypothetical protein
MKGSVVAAVNSPASSVRYRTDGEPEGEQTRFRFRGKRDHLSDCLRALARYRELAGTCQSFQRAASANNRVTRTKKRYSMLYTIAVVLLILWVLGLVSSYTLGGFIHILVVVAVVMILINLISGRRGL